MSTHRLHAWPDVHEALVAAIRRNTKHARYVVLSFDPITLVHVTDYPEPHDLIIDDAEA